MMKLIFVTLIASITTVEGCGLGKFENLVSFGDSLTDDGRAAWFMDTGEAPPPGTVIPVVESASGGRAWGRIAADSITGTYNNYAVQGATCSWDVVKRYFGMMDVAFPSVKDYQVDAFKADLEFKDLYPNRRADNTAYTLWIGTNDLGAQGFLTDTQAPGAPISAVVDCMWDVLDSIYETGGRYFVVVTQGPVQHFPLYKAVERGGVGDSRGWENKTSYNTTAYEEKMMQYTRSVNTMINQGAAFNLKVKDRWPGATVVIYDTYTLMSDMRADPERYFDAPAEVNEPYGFCAPGVERPCPTKPGSPSGYMFFDDLHPSERTWEVVAENFLAVVNGTSSYATYWH